MILSDLLYTKLDAFDIMLLKLVSSHLVQLSSTFSQLCNRQCFCSTSKPVKRSLMNFRICYHKVYQIFSVIGQRSNDRFYIIKEGGSYPIVSDHCANSIRLHIMLKFRITPSVGYCKIYFYQQSVYCI